uniref:EF-hand domain-containing protein n=1 Tax=Trypanosoma congolense (strain IL3000) TaxID=1068625 RepID=G0UXR1_TRYCI|nr:conserved hypothetical protein [Trypanosoma congolense IL3000]
MCIVCTLNSRECIRLKADGMPPRKAKELEACEGNVTIGAKQILMHPLDASRREKFIKKFDDILEAHMALNGGSETTTMLRYKEVPTLSVGFIARAMGLNLSNDQVLRLVEMVEEKEVASRGCVPVEPLRHVIVEGLVKGVLTRPGLPAPTNNRKRRLPASEIPLQMYVSRDSEKVIYEAFRTLDVANRGYIESDELRQLFRSGLEPFTDEEIENMIAAAADPQSGLVYYGDFSDVLANE